LITFDTVGDETPASAAMRAIVVGRRDPLRGSRVAVIVEV
jgi:hypothetical protein